MAWRTNDDAPIIGIEPDLVVKDGIERVMVATAYADAVRRAGGVPVVLHPDPGMVERIADDLDGFIFTGGDDPVMEAFGVVTDERVQPVQERRQRFCIAMLEHLRDRHPAKPVLGVCLGMQYMALIAGGRIDQWMADGLDPGSKHWRGAHPILVEPAGEGLLSPGECHSHHRQAIVDPGSLTIAARSGDGVVEAVVDPGRAFYIGVQWHPERTEDERLGQRVFDRLVEAAK